MSLVSRPVGRPVAPVPVPSGPFALDDALTYRRWRAEKRQRAPQAIEDLVVPIADAGQPNAAERAALIDRIGRANMAIYRSAAPVDRAALRRLGAALGLARLDGHLCAEEDGISQLQVSADRAQGDYIPYTDRPLSWHCDGYYNEPEQRIRAMVLHCVRAAAEGGENALMDHEMLYIALRDRDPAYIEALMHPQALCIPANIQQGEVLRPERTGPVFSVDPGDGRLHLRYTARGRHVRWREDAATREAVACIAEILNADDAPVFRYGLRPGEGIVCNNILHNRTGFGDDPDPGRQRLVYRARFFDRVAET